MRHLRAMALMLLAAGVGGGCTVTHGSLCEQAAACGGGGDFEVEACVAELDAQEEIADIYDCADFYYDWLDCMGEFAVCEGDDLKGPCNEHEDRMKRCIDDRERGKAKID